jgi:hypothetical protein
VHSQTFPGGEVTVSANDGFTEGKLESLSYTFESCGSEEYETSCNWEVTAHLATEPAKRCNPATPSPQTIWSSGEQSGNGTVSPPPLSFPLEGCPGQVFSVSYSYTKTFDPPDKGEFIRIGEGGSATLAFIIFGPTWQETIEKANPPVPPFQPNFTPTKTFGVSLDCKAVSLNSTRYAFAFHRMGCHKASNLARTTYLTGRAPSGYACPHRAGGMLCQRQGQPQKFFEWRRAGTRPAR